MNKEVLKVAQHCVTKGCFYNSCKFGAFPSGECIAYFAKAIVEHFDKYRWHDLKKNPDDLPETEISSIYRFTSYVIAKCETYKHEYYTVAYMNKTINEWFADNKRITDPVVAWREI